ncbi:MAG: hypothetical protein H7A31_02875 [Thermotogae bacterium]|nr:hypothetical protein [Thermotogota bacterium]MCP5465618.1 hypothetical protein [Thermotogota bacterium]HOO74672.1 flavodoxin domain-containing protein [Tepiditoga sp.]
MNSYTIYESTHGFTENIVKQLSLTLKKNRFSKPSEFSTEFRNYDIFIFASPIYREKISQELLNFIKNNLFWLKNKKIAFFSTGILDRDYDIQKKIISDLFGKEILYEKIGGKIDFDSLSPEESVIASDFVKRKYFTLNDENFFDTKRIILFSEKIRELFFQNNQKIDFSLFKKISRPVVSSCFNNKIFSEEMTCYFDSSGIYLLTEGSEVFSTVFLSKHISLFFTETEKRLSLNINGHFEQIEQFSQEYYKILNKIGVSENLFLRKKTFIKIVKVSYETIKNSKYSSIS